NPGRLVPRTRSCTPNPCVSAGSGRLSTFLPMGPEGPLGVHYEYVGQQCAAATPRPRSGHDHPPGEARARQPILRPRVLLRGARLELKADEALITDHPSVVARFDHVGLAGSKLELCAVVVCHMHATRLNNANVSNLAPVRTHDRLPALGPFPAGFESKASSGCGPQMDDINAGLVRRPRL